MEKSILEIIRTALVGKSIKVQTYKKQICEMFYVRIKKSNNVTDAQFNSGNTKFSYMQPKHKVIGYHAKYETLTITDFRIENGCEYNEIYSYITLSNGTTYSFDDYFETPIEDIIINNNLITKF